MMAGNPSWWSMHGHSHSELRSSAATAAACDHDHDHDHHQADAPPNLLLSQRHPSNYSSLFPLHEYLHPSSSLTSLPHQHTQPHDFPHSWSQLLLGGLASHEHEERFGASVFQSTRILSNATAGVKQEVSSQSNNNNNNSNLYGYNHEEQEAAGVSNRLAVAAAWSQAMPVSSPRSRVTTLTNNNILDFSTNNSKRLSLQTASTQQHADHSNSESNSSAIRGVPKKPKIHSSSNPPLKVRKEKLGDRITALHQLVSPFGKTDTASVLLEAIGYIGFLEAQIQALSSPYWGNNNASTKNQRSETKEGARDLKSRGLCLVPISCTHLVGSDNGAHYWAQMQSLGGGF